GTAYLPPAEPAVNAGDAGLHGRAANPATPTRPMRRRRPGMIALAVALMAVGILASGAVYSMINRRLAVLLVEAPVPAGTVIHARDLGTAKVSVGSRVQVIPATRLKQVFGHVAGTTLHPGMLLIPADLTTERSPGPGQALVS